MKKWLLRLSYKNINLVKGYSEEYTLEPSAAGGHENTGRRIYSKLDNAPMSYGCYCHAKGMELGIKSGDGKYVCILDNDSIFLNEWFPIILEKEYDEITFHENPKEKKNTICNTIAIGV